jgi:hypothetical protein
LSLFDRASFLAVAFLAVVILWGMIRHRLHRLCWTFAAYLGVVGFGNTLMAAAPATFYNWDFWQAKDLAYTTLTLLVALEIAALSFQAFPGAKKRARQISIVILVATLAAVVWLPEKPSTNAISNNLQVLLYVEVQPRLSHGTAMLFATVWALVLWYVIPLHRWHRAILRGLAPYMLATTIIVRLLATWGSKARLWVGYADSVAYLAVLTYWAWEAWRDQPPADHLEIRSRLQPWLDKR